MAMTGVRAYSGTSITEIVKAVCAPPPVPSLLQSQIPGAVDAWFAKACAAEPKDRYPTALALSAAFGDAWRTDSMKPAPDSRSRSPGTMAATEPDSRPGPVSGRAPAGDAAIVSAPALRSATPDKRTRRTTRVIR
jgi:serine/threonine-protein kinase